MHTPEQFAEAMQTSCNLYYGDEEAAHAAADDLLMEQLEELGYAAGVAIFRQNQEDWWYA